MPSLRLAIHALVLALLVTGALMWSLLSERAGALLPSGSDFTLQAADGPLDSRALRGQVVLLYFGYTLCPDVCPTTLSAMGTALASLRPEEQQQVRGVFVSLDPVRDTVERLKDYAPYFHPRIVGATGSEAQLTSLVTSYGATFRRVPLEDGEGYAVEHPSSVYVLDPSGRLVQRIAHGSSLATWQYAIRDALSR